MKEVVMSDGDFQILEFKPTLTSIKRNKFIVDQIRILVTLYPNDQEFGRIARKLINKEK